MPHHVTIDPTAKIPDNLFYSTKVCPTCHGEGEVPSPDTFNNPENMDKVEKYKDTCPQCKGAKRVPKEFISN
jgi:DnaJ-class molecular chaperone